MKPFDLVVLGLALSSSWGNGHATTYRALLEAYAAEGRRILFLERDRPWYAAHRDLPAPGWCRLELYSDLADLEAWRPAIAEARAVMVGSYVPDGIAVARLVQETAGGVTAFYDIDTPVTLAALERGDCDYLTADLVPGFDLYLSFAGGRSLERLESQFGAKAARALFCSVDARAYRPVPAETRWDLGYLGTYAEDRQPVLETLLIEPARRAPDLRFVVAGPQYPKNIEWPANVTRIDHVGPADHPAFYAACRFTLNATRRDMVRAGHSPSVRLFEAGACGTPIISDAWAGLDDLFEPGRDILVATDAADVLAALLDMSEADRAALAARGRERVLAGHTAVQRARELADYIAAVERSAATAVPA